MTTSLRFLNLILPFVQVIVPYLHVIFTKSRAIGQEANNSPIVPAKYAFSIWFIIFLLSIIYGIYQFLPEQKESEVLGKIRLYTALTFLFSSLWMVVAQLSSKPYTWLTVILIIALFCSLVVPYLEVSKFKNQMNLQMRIFSYLTFSLYAGWVSLALFLNIGTVLYGKGMTSIWIPFWLLIGAVILSSIMIWIGSGNLAYLLTLMWGLIALFIANIGITNNRLISFSSLAAMAVLACIFIIRNKLLS